MEQLFKRSGDIVSAPINETLLLLNVDSGLYHELNPIAVRIWDMLEQSMALETIVEQLLLEFDVSPETCRLETSEFLEQLRVRGLLTTE